MNKTLLLLSFCLAFVLICNSPQICIGAEATSGPVKNEPAKTGKKWSSWVSLDAYKIGGGDVLEIMTWKEPEFSREEVLVRIDGRISFPLLGDIHVAGRTPLEVKKDIETGLKDYVDNPIVTIHVKNPGSQKIYILGEVVNTGEYPMIKDLIFL